MRRLIMKLWHPLNFILFLLFAIHIPLAIKVYHIYFGEDQKRSHSQTIRSIGDKISYARSNEVEMLSLGDLDSDGDLDILILGDEDLIIIENQIPQKHQQPANVR